MKTYRNWMVLAVLACGAVQIAHADCVISEAVKPLDPVAVGFCESDAVFVGKSEGAIESIGGVTEEGAPTRHFRTQRSTLRVLERYKGAKSETVTMIADLYAKQGAYAFEAGKTYLVFAKRLAGENEYAGAGACSVQPTLLIDDAEQVLKQLEQQKQGREKVNCKTIRAKEKA